MKLKEFAILTRKPRSHARILIYRTWPIVNTFSGEKWQMTSLSSQGDLDTKKEHLSYVFYLYGHWVILTAGMFFLCRNLVLAKEVRVR